MKALKKCPQKLLIIGLDFCFFSAANRSETNPDLNFCSINIAHRVTYCPLCQSASVGLEDAFNQGPLKSYQCSEP